MTHKNDFIFNEKLNGKEKFGFRKSSVGLVAVTLGTIFFLSNGQLVHADETSVTQQVTSTKVKETTQEDTNNSDQLTNTIQSETQTASDTQGSFSTNTKNNESDTDNKKIEKTATLNISPLKPKNNDSTLTASLTENKTAIDDQPSYSSTVTAIKKNDDTNLTKTTTKDSPTILASDQDTVEVDTTVELNNVKKVTKDKPITIQIINSNTDLTEPLMTNDKINDSDNWCFEKRADLDNAFDAWYNGTILPTSVTFRVNVLANNSKVKDYLTKNTGKSGEDIPVGVKIFYPTNESETKTAFYASYIPTQDRINSGEILQGFQMVTTDVKKETGYGNISESDKQTNNLKDNDTVYQWGFYFNYGNNSDPNNIITLANAQFSTIFHNQIFLPSSIKIFEVPANLVSDEQGNRYSIDDTPAGQSQNIYNYLTTHPDEQKAFENYLKANSNKSGFSIDQSKDGTFYIPTNGQNDTSYSKHAYFIQVDTAVTNPKDAPVWIEIHSNSGSTLDHSVIWQNTTGSGTEAQNTQEAVLKYYDDETGQFLKIVSPLSDQAISVKGQTNDWIDFGDIAQNNFNTFIKNNYQYSRITIGANADSKNIILDPEGKTATFSSTGIFPQFDNINDNTNGTDSHPQYFIVHFTHKKQVAESQSTTIIEHISYYYENGSKKGQAVPKQYAPIKQELHFIRNGQTDLVTGKTTYSNWQLINTNSSELSLPAILFSQLPQILDENYKLDPNGTFIVSNNIKKPFSIVKGNSGSIPAISFNDNEITALYNQNGGSIIIQVPYIQTIKPSTNPSVPKPTQPAPSQPSQQPTSTPAPSPTTPVTPLPTVEPTVPAQPTNAPVLPNDAPVKRVTHKSSTIVAPHAQTQKQKYGHDYNYTSIPKATSTRIEKHTTQSKKQLKIVISKAFNHKENTLPQTGENKFNLGAIGLAFVAIANLLGLTIDRKRKN